MSIRVLMPALSPTMTEGKLAVWKKKEGDKIKSGDVLAEIETDKATMEVEAIDEGILAKILIPANTDAVAVNSVIAIIAEEGEDPAKIEAGSSAPAPIAVAVSAAPVAAVAAAPVVNVQKTDVTRLFASPLARRIAAQHGLDLAKLSGSGPNGRIVKHDVETALAAGTAVAASKAAAAPVAASIPASSIDARALADAYGQTYRLQPNSNTRRTIARRLSEAKATVPHFYLTIDCDIDVLLAARKRLNEANPALKCSVNDFVIKAAAMALKEVPGANAGWHDDGILLYDHADISVAVSTPNGLITPIIPKAEGKGLAQISSEMKELAAKARDGKLKPAEYQGGSFTISNLGMFGVKQFEAIINPPQACILAVGAGEQRAVVRNGALTIATQMSVTLSVDHRAVDGALGAEFLAAFKRNIEDPIRMIL